MSSFINALMSTRSENPATDMNAYDADVTSPIAKKVCVGSSGSMS